MLLISDLRQELDVKTDHPREEMTPERPKLLTSCTVDGIAQTDLSTDKITTTTTSDPAITPPHTPTSKGEYRT